MMEDRNNYAVALWIVIPVVLLILGLIGFGIFRKSLFEKPRSKKTANMNQNNENAYQSKTGALSFICGILSFAILVEIKLL